MGKKAIVWFRNDLRIHDNESLTEAIEMAEGIIPVFIFDKREIKGKTSFGFRKIGIHRTRFLIESVTNLRSNLRKIGLPLIVRYGVTEDILFQIAQEQKTSWIFCNRERTYEEVKVQDAVEQRLWSIGQEVRYNRGKMLYYTADLPFPVTHTPDTFTTFRKEVEKITPIRPPLPIPARNKYLGIEIDEGNIPTLNDFGFTIKEIKTLKPRFTGGEDEALKRLSYYFWDHDLISTYFDSRNGMLGDDYSSKFSPYLALGCISPKLIYEELKRYEKIRKKNKSTYWLFFELLWRDFFRLMGKKHGNKIFLINGPREIEKEWKNDMALFIRWAKGNTGIPLIDANMIELNKTGFMSNRGRQNVASFLVNDLGLNWLMGAEYFESLLLDYDPCSNYGNWNYLAGVGSDPRENRYFNIIGQSKKYDAKAEYVRSMIPVLKQLPIEYVHNPGTMARNEQEKHNFKIGENYPQSIVNLS